MKLTTVSLQLRPVVLLALLVLGTFASTAAAAPEPRIVNGGDADQGEYPSQGFLLITVGASTRFCGGTLVSQTKFLTAAHCTVDGVGAPLAPSAFEVWLGQRNLSSVGPAGKHPVSQVQVHEDYDAGSSRFDVAMLTLAQPVTGLAARRIVKAGETALWATGVNARIIGWGAYFFGDTASHDTLREAEAPIRTDATCSDPSSYGSFFHQPSMLCAGAADPANNSSDTCQGDSGGPLLVPDGLDFALAGVTSTGKGCNTAGFPGIYARVGAPALNAWVRSRLYSLDFSNGKATAAQPTTFTATAAPGTGDFRWDFDGNGSTDASGASVTHAFPAAGAFPVTLRATDPEGEPAERKRAVVAAAAPTPTAAPSVTPPVALTRRSFATLLIGKTAMVDRRGRFRIRIKFDALAPAGKKAVLTVKKGTVKVGSAKVAVARGKSVRARVKLTKAGLRRLRKTKRLKVTVRFVLGTTVQTKTVTLKLR